MNSEGIRRIVAEIAYRRARRIHQAQSEPRLLAIYIQRHSETRSLNTTVIEHVRFLLNGREIPIPFGIRALAILDVLVRCRPSTLTASQIEHILKTDSISAGLGPRRLMCRKVIKVYMGRIRAQLAKVLRKKGIVIDPKRLLASEETELANAKGYRLGMHCRIVYRDRNAAGGR